MSPADPVRIVLATRLSAAGDAQQALSRLGAEAHLEVVHDAETCLALCRRGAVDLVVVEWPLESERLLSSLPADGPPLILVGPPAEAERALRLFARGAADWVAAGREMPEALAVAALEHIRAFRAARERGAVERRFRDLERYTENIIQNMNSALLVVDREGRITTTNPPAAQILGDSSAALRGRAVWAWLPDGPREEQFLARTLEEGTRFKGAESALTRPDGTVVPIGISCSPVLDAEGARIGAVAIFQDLTEMKQLQRQVLHTEKMASIGQLAAGVAHEINNPMGFIHANLFQMTEYAADLRRVWERVDVLQKQLAHGSLEAARAASAELAAASEEADVAFLLTDLEKAIRESQEGSERIRHIVQDLRDFSHRGTDEPVLADVNQCLDSTATIVLPMMKHLVELERDYADLESLYCYPMQLKQVFTNLLVNAYHAIEERVGDSGEMGTIRLRTETVPDGVAISFSDSGCGIPPEHLDRIFDPFFTTKKVGAGTGLGLSTSYNIVKRHGGSLTALSQPGRGTTFRVFLPAAVPEGDGS